jgi:hypothetical protein
MSTCFEWLGSGSVGVRVGSNFHTQITPRRGGPADIPFEVVATCGNGRRTQITRSFNVP